jgi:hypothetical protein
MPSSPLTLCQPLLWVQLNGAIVSHLLQSSAVPLLDSLRHDDARGDHNAISGGSNGGELGFHGSGSGGGGGGGGGVDTARPLLVFWRFLVRIVDTTREEATAALHADTSTNTSTNATAKASAHAKMNANVKVNVNLTTVRSRTARTLDACDVRLSRVFAFFCVDFLPGRFNHTLNLNNHFLPFLPIFYQTLTLYSCLSFFFPVLTRRPGRVAVIGRVSSALQTVFSFATTGTGTAGHHSAHVVAVRICHAFQSHCGR